MRVAYFSPMPPEPSGIADYSALLVPALREHVDVEVVKRGPSAPARTSTSPFTTSATIRTRTAGSSTRCGARRALVVLHDFVLHHLVAGVTIGRGDGHGYLDAMEREHGVVGRLLAPRRARQAAAAALGGPAGGLPARGRGALARDGPSSRTRATSPTARARRASRADLPRAAPRLAGTRTSRRPPSTGDAARSARSGTSTRASACRSSSRRSPACAGEHPGARLLLVGATSPGFDLDRRLQRLGLDGEGIVREG